MRRWLLGALIYTNIHQFCPLACFLPCDAAAMAGKLMCLGIPSEVIAADEGMTPSRCDIVSSGRDNAIRLYELCAPVTLDRRVMP